MQHKNFIKNLFLLLLLNLLIKPFWILVVEPYVQYKVGNQYYGEYFTLFNFSFLFAIFLDFGLVNFNNRNIAQNSHLLSKHFSNLITLKLSMAGLYVAITMFIGWLIGFNARYLKLLFVLTINQFFISMVLYLRSNLLGLHLFKIDSFVSVLDRLIMISIIGIIFFQILPIELNIMSFVYAQVIAYAITAFIAFYAVWKQTEHFKFAWNWKFNILILKKSTPYAILILLMVFYNRLDAVMLERILPYPDGAIHAGIYAKAFRFLDAANMIAYLFSVQLLPIFAKLIEEKQNIEEITKLAFSLLIIPAVITSVSCFFYSKELVALINKGTTDAADVFSILMFCFTAISTTYIFGTLLTANGNLKQLNTMAICGIIINIILNLILIPKFKSYGSAWASVITQFFTAIVQVWMAKKIFHFKINKNLFRSLTIFIVGVVIINYFSTLLSKQWMTNFVIMIILSTLWAFLSQLISLHSALKLLKIKK
ncbi:MAG: polysaccharide biosynthesis C-terminal domain-containing protein [Bacteroidia bacterium]|nr:polysaccharide biosynthesis C-terminal domain-containing protein [Bacteroidia bacterium]